MLLLYGGKYSWTQSLEKTDMRWQYHYFHISVQYCFLFVIVYYWGGEVSLKTIFNHISHHFMVAGVQEDWDDVTKYTNLLSQCIPLSLIKFQILDPFSSVPIQIMRYFRHFDSLFFAPLWDLPAPIGNKSGSRDKIADQSRVGHVIQNSAQSQASTRMSWAWFYPTLSSVHVTFPTVTWCHTLFAPKVVCPKSCTKLYQEREKVPSLENASTTPNLDSIFELTQQIE